MAGLRVFISSTCYDLSTVRGQLRIFINTLGHEPVMSDYNDVLYDPRVHTHISCLDEVRNCDVVVLIIGSRFGGSSVPPALNQIDIEKMLQESTETNILKEPGKMSVTQLEILKAVDQGLPVFSFIDERVWHDHLLYEKNKSKSIISDILFPSIEKPETATYIFEFINFLKERTRNNSVFRFSKINDIEDILRLQWSALFQRLLKEQNRIEEEFRSVNVLSEKFEDLKTAIITSLGSSKDKEVARGVVRFRQLYEFLRSLKIHNVNFVLSEKHSWDELLDYAEIVNVISSDELPFELTQTKYKKLLGERTYFIKKDNTFYEGRFGSEHLNSLKINWNAFNEHSKDIKSVIIDALSEAESFQRIMRYYSETFDEFIDNSISSTLQRDQVEFSINTRST